MSETRRFLLALFAAAAAGLCLFPPVRAVNGAGEVRLEHRAVWERDSRDVRVDWPTLAAYLAALGAGAACYAVLTGGRAGPPGSG